MEVLVGGLLQVVELVVGVVAFGFTVLLLLVEVVFLVFLVVLLRLLL